MPKAGGNAIQQAQRLGQSIWFDSISRDLIESGELQRLVDLGITGVTSNPTIFDKAVSEGASYDEALLRYTGPEADADAAFEAIAIRDIQDAADILRPVYERADGADGFVSIEVSPLLARDTAGTVSEARRLFEAIDRPNAMIKVPGTPEGMPAIYSLVSRGINVNVTLLFALSAYRRAAEAYIEGLQDYLRSRGERVARVASVASFFVSRVDTAVDRLLDGAAGKGHDAGAEAARLKGKAAVANAKLAYAEFQRIFGTGRFAALSRAGARVQRPLWASTSTKNPAYSPTLYVDPLVGPHTVNTMPPQTLDAFLERGPVEETITRGADGARAHMKALESVGIDMDAVADRLLQEGLKAFTDSYLSVVERVRHKCEALRRAAGTGRSA